MRIAILADPITNQNAGVHYYTKALVENLALLKSKNEYFIVTENKIELPYGLNQIVIKSHQNILYRAFRMLFVIPFKMRKLNMDIVIEPAHFGPFNLPKRINRVTVIHDLTPILFPQYHLWHSQMLQRIFLPDILRKANHIFTNSNYTLQDIEKNFPFTKNKVTAIHLGTDLLEYKLEPIRAKNIPSKYFLFVGTLEPRKNIKTLVRAFELFKDHQKDDYLKLVLIGQKGWKSTEIFNTIQNSPYHSDIITPGYVKRSELINWYSFAEATIMPSFYEGFGMTVIESMACGTPCIISDISSLPEIGGDAVLKFDAEDPDQLKNRMVEMMDSGLKEKLIARSLKKVQKFSWIEHARKFDELLCKLFDK